MKINVKNPVAVVKRAFFLAWKACGGPIGRGVLQDRGPNMTEAQVWMNSLMSGDYPDRGMDTVKEGQISGDYVFGRMMKLRVSWDANSVTISDNTPRGDYQSWCGKYPTYQSLIEAADHEINL